MAAELGAPLQCRIEHAWGSTRSWAVDQRGQRDAARQVKPSAGRVEALERQALSRYASRERPGDDDMVTGLERLRDSLSDSAPHSIAQR